MSPERIKELKQYFIEYDYNPEGAACLSRLTAEEMLELLDFYAAGHSEDWLE